MNHDRQVALVRHFFELRDKGTTAVAPATYGNPACVYTSPEHLARERETLFRGAPLLAGLSGDARLPGEYFCFEADGLPLVLVRGEDGLLRAFVNACRHRGARLLDGRGRLRRTITCSFHAWTYDANGRLLGQPLAQDYFADRDQAELCLRQVPVAERHGLVFVRPLAAGDDRDDPVDVDGLLEGAEEEIAHFGFDRYWPVESRTQVRPLNWKLVVDTFLEAYHIFSLHKQTIGPWYFSHPMLYDSWGGVGRLVGVRRTITDLEERPESDWTLLPHGTIQYIVPPNVVLTHQLDHVELWQVFPGSRPGEARITTSLYAPEEPSDEGALDYWRRNLDLLLEVTDNEDFPQAEATQAALEAGALDHFVFGRNEPALIHYHQTLARLLGQRE